MPELLLPPSTAATSTPGRHLGPANPDSANGLDAANLATPLKAAQHAAKIHRKLGRMAHRTKKISVDRVWEVYVQTGGDLAQTKAIIEEVDALNSQSKVVSYQSVPGMWANTNCQNKPLSPQAQAHAQIHAELVHLARKSEVFSVDCIWSVYAKTGSVVRVGEVLKEMGEVVLRTRGRKEGEGEVDNV